MRPVPTSTAVRRGARIALLAAVSGAVLLWTGASAGLPSIPVPSVVALVLEPAAGPPGTPVTASGSCSLVPEPAGPSSYAGSSSTTPPDLISVYLDGQVLGESTIDDSGAFAVDFTVPVGTSPGVHRVTTAPACGEADFDVLAPVMPTLALAPARAAVPTDVTASGTCPPGRDDVVIFLDGEPLLAVTPDRNTGAFGPALLHLPGGLVPAVHAMTTSCGASARFTVLAPPGPGTTPPPTTPPPTTPPTASTSAPLPLVEVPDLVGRTEAEAIGILGDQLRLANPSGAGGRITGQDPAAGSRIPLGSAVTVAWESAPPAGALPVVLAAGLAAVLVAAAVTWWIRRARRGRRWSERHVGTAACPGPASVDTQPAGEEVPAHRVRLEPHPDLERPPQEVPREPHS